MDSNDPAHDLRAAAAANGHTVQSMEAWGLACACGADTDEELRTTPCRDAPTGAPAWNDTAAARAGQREQS